MANNFNVHAGGSANISGVAIGDNSSASANIGVTPSDQEAIEAKLAEIIKLLDEQRDVGKISTLTRSYLAGQVSESGAIWKSEGSGKEKKELLSEHLARVLASVKNALTDSGAIIACIKSLALMFGLPLL